MAVLNVTPDSFHSYSRQTTAQAVASGRTMIEQGADVIDVGGESTRPGAASVDAQTELERVIPVIEALADDATISVDTRKAEVAREGIASGATIINDVSSSLGLLAAELGVGWVASHMRGEPASMQQDPTYDHVVDEVFDHLIGVADAARDAGAPDVWIDPGIGFGKTLEHNLDLIAHIDRFVASDYKVVLGVSRKSFLGTLHARSDSGFQTGSDMSDNLEPVPTSDRLEGSIAIAAWAFAHGVDMMRVHDLEPTLQAAAVVGK